MIAADRLHNDYPNIFNFLDKNGFCSSNCNNHKTIHFGRVACFDINRESSLSPFMQYFLFLQEQKGTKFYSRFVSRYPKHNEKLFKIVASHYLTKEEVEYLRSESGNNKEEGNVINRLLDNYNKVEKQKDKNKKNSSYFSHIILVGV